jgi:hypothetical protein
MAALGAAKAIKGKKDAANAATADWEGREDERQRRQSAFDLTELPQLQGAESRKTMGNLFARGMWGNFGRDPGTGKARSSELQAILNDPWKYRDTGTLRSLSPHAKKLKKPKGPGLGGYLGAGLLGAGSGAASYYMSGKGGGGGGGGGGFSGSQLLSAAGYKPPSLASLQGGSLATSLRG